MTSQQTRIGVAVVVTVTGEVDMLTAPRLREAVRAALDDPHAREVVIDLTPVTFLSSSGLAALVQAKHDAARRGEPVRVVVDHARPVISPIKAAGLDGVLALYRRLDEALPPASEPTV
jgi:anti-sigma B factor antagonist